MTNPTIRHLSLEEEGRYILQECGVMAVGVQALLGFQMLSILTPALYDRLEPALRLLHLGGIVLVIISMFLLLTPACYHRLAESDHFSAKFVDAAVILVGWALAFLRLGLVVEIYTATRALGFASASALGLSAGLFLLSWTLWSVYPRVSVMRLAPRTKSD